MHKDQLINELKSKEEEISKLKAELDLVKTQMNLILDLEDLALWDWNVPNDVMERHNAHWKNLYEMKNERITAQFIKRTFPEDIEELGKVYTLHNEDKATKFSQTYRLSNQEGTDFKWIRSSGKILERDNQGNPKRVLGVSKDVSIQKIADDELVKASNEYQKLFNYLNSFYAEHKVIYDKEGEAVDLEYTRVNKAFLEFLSMEENELVGKTTSEIFPILLNDDDWFERFVSTAQTGIEQTFTKYALGLGLHLKCTLFSPKKDYAAISFTDVSTEVNALEQIKKMNTSLNLCLELDQLGYWEWLVAEDKIIGRNTYWKEIYEMEPANISPQFDDRIPEEDKEKVWSVITEGLKKDEPYSHQFKIWNKDKTKLKWIENTGKVLERDKEGNPVRVLGVTKEITADREKEQGLIRATKELNRAQSLSKIGSWYLDVGTNEVTWTEEIYRMYGFDSSLPPPPYTEHMKLFTDESWEVLSTKLALTATKGIPYDLELEMATQEASFGWMRAMGEAVKDAHGKTIGIRGTAQDITEIKHINSILEERRMFAETLTESSPAGIYVFDHRQGKTTYTNARASEILGYSAKQFAKMSAKDFLAKFHPDDKTMVEEHLSNVIESNRASKIRFRFKHSRGHYITCLSTDTAFEYNEKGRLKSFLGSFVDISELQEKEEELIKAKNEAEKANQYKDVFLSNLSHEIRTPMNAIVGFANMLKEDRLSDEKRTLYVKQVNDNSKQLLVLLNDILDVTRLESGELPFNYEKIELNNLMFEIHESYTSQLRDRTDIKLESYRKDNTRDVFFFTDPIRIKQVLNNLVDNAIKYSESGIVEVGYSASESLIIFEVKDQGIGISKKDQKIIFDRFEQVSHDKYATKGSGLGLAITKGILSKLNGSIELESSAGKGSTFTASIPFISSMFTSEIELESGYSLNKKVRKLLIADDSPTIRMYYNMLLENEGLEVIMAQDGKEAYELFRKNRDVDMVFLDIKMPKLNGIEVMKKIRKIDSDMPLVAQTAFALHDEVKKFLDLGFNHCITKPVARQDLFSILGLVDS